MTKCLILQSFGYSPDGRHVRLLEAGVIEDIRPELVAGLVSSGQIESRDPMIYAMTPPDGTAPDTKRKR
jgi:hypothetical protein